MKFYETVIQRHAFGIQIEGAFNYMAMKTDQKILIDFDVEAHMRDGTTLRANVYRPAGDDQWPVLLTRLPYGKDFPLGSSVMDPAQVARRGYVVIVFFFQAEDGIRDLYVTGVQTCALPI